MLLAGIATSGTLRTDVDSFKFAGFAFAWYSGIGTRGRMPPPLSDHAPSLWKTPAARSRFAPPTKVMKGRSHTAFAPRGAQRVAPGGRGAGLGAYAPLSPLD